MAKFLLTVLFGTCLSTAYAGIEVRNGGGGVTRDGLYMTFKSAQVPIQSRELATSELSSLQILVRVIQTSLLNADTKAKLTRYILPSIERHYYKADFERLDENTKRKISLAYAKLMGTSDNFTIFAVTDVLSQSTALFPPFFKLTPTEQATILFHESLWTLPGASQYDDVVQAEIAFQTYLESPTPSSQELWYFYRSLLIAIKDYTQLPGIAYTLVAKDISKIPIRNILGAEGFQCLVDTMVSKRTNWESCNSVIINNLSTQTVASPENYFQEALYNYLMSPYAALSLSIEESNFPTQQTSPATFADTQLFMGPSNLNNTSLKFPLRNSKGIYQATLQFQ